MSWAGLRLAVTLLTAVPVPGRPWSAGMRPDRRTAAAAMYWAPVVGLALGGAAAAALTGCRAAHL
ncbi:MAG: adenosylcobinamide-GDP ribazoletransferase, partial [Actinobacteria bacterium]|nr:adenosylcobinamide-GDP ribazoletransferase [Actinomycetota bacterium]